MASSDVQRSSIDTPIISKRFDELSVSELYAILRLRSEVFVVEQECVYADPDGRDEEAETVHHWIDSGGHVAAYARTLSDADDSVRIGRVVTAPSDRGIGLAAALVEHITESAVAWGSRSIVLDAQSHLAGWYERLGYVRSGDEFVEDGIPHTPMRHVGGTPISEG